MTDSMRRELHKACSTLERYRIETYERAEISCIDRESGAILIKPRGECEIHEIRADSDSLHAMLYARFQGVTSILLVNPEWIGVASDAGWVLDHASYGYIPSFADTVPCTKKIRAPLDSVDYPRAFCDAVSDVTSDGIPRAVLVRSRGAVIFASSPASAAEYAVTLEYAAKKAFYARKIR